MLTRLILTLLLAAGIAACSFDEPAAVEAKFEASAAGCTVPCTITFTDISENKSVYNWKYEWRLVSADTVAIDSGRSLTFNFVESGKYLVTLSLTNEKYGTSVAEQEIVILDVLKPIAAFDQVMTDSTRKDSVTIAFTNKSTNATRYAWNFGDGSPIDSVRMSPTHTYARKAVDTTYAVKLVVKAGTLSNEKSQSVKIAKKK